MDKNLNPNIEPSEKQQSIISEIFQIIDNLDDGKQRELLAFVQGVAFWNPTKSKAS